MKRMIPVFLGLAAAGGFSAQALADDIYKTRDSGLYAGLNYTFMNVDSDQFDADVGTLSAKVGALATPYFGLEARGGFGVEDDTISGVDVSVDNFFGGYATLNLANESPATPYAIFGFSRLEIEAESALGSAKDDDTDISYGVGVNVAMAPEVSGNLEYMRYFDKDGTTIDGLGLGVTFNF